MHALVGVMTSICTHAYGNEHADVYFRVRAQLRLCIHARVGLHRCDCTDADTHVVHEILVCACMCGHMRSMAPIRVSIIAFNV